MSKGLTLFLGVLAAGMVQFGLTASVAEAHPLIVAASVVGAMGTTLAGLLTRLPGNAWTETERSEKLNG